MTTIPDNLKELVKAEFAASTVDQKIVLGVCKTVCTYRCYACDKTSQKLVSTGGLILYENQPRYSYQTCADCQQWVASSQMREVVEGLYLPLTELGLKTPVITNHGPGTMITVAFSQSAKEFQARINCHSCNCTRSLKTLMTDTPGLREVFEQGSVFNFRADFPPTLKAAYDTYMTN